MSQQSTYRVDFGMCALVVCTYGLPFFILIGCVLWVGIHQARVRGLLAIEPFAVSLLFPSVPLVWLSRFRLVFAERSLAYRSWSQRESVIPYIDIASVEVSKAAPIAKAPISTHVNLKDGTFVIIYTKAFSWEAVRRLYALGEGPNNSFKPKPLRGSA